MKDDKQGYVTDTAEFIQAAKRIHAERYGYDKAIYRSPTQRLTLSCKKHGDFDIMARDHLEGKGCGLCRREEDFINKVHLKYGELFSTDTVNYVNASTPVELVCSLHGSFLLSPEKVLSNACACPQCAEDAMRKHAEDTRIRTYERKIKALSVEQQEKDDFYSRLIAQLESSADTYQDYISKIVEILFELDDYSLEEVNKHIRDEIRRRKGTTSARYSKEQENDISLLPDSFVALDFETLYPQRVSACSIGLVKYVNGIITDKFYSLIRPPFDYPNKKGAALTWIHGFRESDFEDEQIFPEILPRVESFIGGLPLVAHNCSVERGCFRDCCKYYNLQTAIDYNNILDTLTLSHLVESKQGSHVAGCGTHSLDAVCQRFSVEILHHHNALDDAEMCGNLLLRFKHILESEQIDTSQEIPSLQASDLMLDLLSMFDASQPNKTQKINPEDKIQRTDLDAIEDNPFKDCTVVLTGFSIALSQEYGHKLNLLGAKLTSSVSKKTQWLICGANAGPSKLKKAEDVGAKIIYEDDFLKLIK